MKTTSRFDARVYPWQLREKFSNHQVYWMTGVTTMDRWAKAGVVGRGARTIAARMPMTFAASTDERRGTNLYWAHEPGHWVSEELQEVYRAYAPCFSAE